MSAVGEVLTKQATILVVEDEPSFVEALQIGLTREGFSVEVADDGRSAIALFRATNPDLVLLDVMLPGRSGVDICREIRSESAVPIIMVTAKSSEIDTVVGLEVGADDYVTKPYRMRELVARIRAQLRRATLTPSENEGADTDSTGELHRVGEVQLDANQHLVTVDGAPVALPLKEFELLRQLLKNVGNVMTREVLIERVWGADYFGDTKTLDVHVKRLRAKLERDPSNPSRIVTVRGVGYKFERA